MELNELSGLELLTGMANGTIPYPSIADTMGFRAAEIKKGYVKFTAMADKRHLNPLGTVHGGFAASILDSVTGCAVHSALEAGVGYGTVDLNVKMLRAIPVDKELIAESTVLHISNRLGVSEGTLKDADGKLYAHGTATCMIYR